MPRLPQGNGKEAVITLAELFRKPLVVPLPPAGAAPPPAPGTPKRFTDVLAGYAGRAGVAIVSGLGLAGSIAVLGGAIAWVRFDAAGLPANQAVDAVPRHELIVIGAAALIPFAVVGLGVVIGLFALDPRGTVSIGTMVGLLGLVGLELGYVTTTRLEAGAVMGLVVLVFGLAFMTLGIAQITRYEFAWFGAAVFGAVIVFGGVTSYLIEKDDAKVQPLAVLRPNEKQGLMGVYVAATSDRIYIGRLQRGGRAAGLYVLSWAPGTRIAIGRRMLAKNVGTADKLLLRRLKRDRVQRLATTAGKGSKKGHR